MKVRMKTLYAGPAGVFQPGSVVGVGDEEGQALIEGGYATLVAEPKPKRKRKPRKKSRKKKAEDDNPAAEEG